MNTESKNLLQVMVKNIFILFSLGSHGSGGLFFPLLQFYWCLLRLILCGQTAYLLPRTGILCKCVAIINLAGWWLNLIPPEFFQVKSLTIQFGPSSKENS
jgi:hypothetical protein